MTHLGAKIKDARRRRRIPISLMAEPASIIRTTLNKIEKGDATVSIGLYGAVLFVLGLHKSLEQIGDLAFNEA
jgi:DNA-binding XRE family transcriptional regulator